VSPKPRTPSSIVDAISERLSSNEDRPPFLRGLTLGALVGAAIAGSTLWNRWRARKAEPHSDIEASPSPDEEESQRS
jgi:hypothetical protein